MIKQMCVMIFIVFLSTSVAAQTTGTTEPAKKPTFVDVHIQKFKQAYLAVKSVLPIFTVSPMCEVHNATISFMEARANLAKRAKANHETATLVRESSKLITKSTSMDVKTDDVSMRFRPSVKNESQVGITVKGKF